MLFLWKERGHPKGPLGHGWTLPLEFLRRSHHSGVGGFSHLHMNITTGMCGSCQCYSVAGQLVTEFWWNVGTGEMRWGGLCQVMGAFWVSFLNGTRGTLPDCWYSAIWSPVCRPVAAASPESLSECESWVPYPRPNEAKFLEGVGGWGWAQELVLISTPGDF